MRRTRGTCQMIHDICVEIRKALEEEEDLEKVVTQAFLNLDRALQRHLSNYGNSEDNTHTPQLMEISYASS